MRVSIVLPCLNEADGVGQVVREGLDALRDAGVAGEVIVADNGSTDGSPAIAKSTGATVLVVHRRGYGAALMAGFRAATGDVILMADADGSYDFDSLPLFLERIRAGDDVVIGSRYRGRIAPRAMPWLHRYVGNPVLSHLLNLFFGTQVSDAQCGVRALRRDVVARMRLRMPGMEFASEMVVNAARARLAIGEVPVDYRVRRGRSKLRPMRDAWRHVRFLLIYSPTHLFVLPGATLLVIGFALLVFLVSGPRSVAGLYFDVHYLVLGALLALLGFQIAFLGVFAKSLAQTSGAMVPEDATLRIVRLVLSLERGLLIGGALVVFGLVVDAYVLAGWAASGFGPLDEVRRALVALVAIVLGVQIAFSSFFLSVIDWQARGSDAAGDSRG